MLPSRAFRSTPYARWEAEAAIGLRHGLPLTWRPVEPAIEERVRFGSVDHMRSVETCHTTFFGDSQCPIQLLHAGHLVIGETSRRHNDTIARACFDHEGS